MDLKKIEYILKIAEEQNITHAAEKLFITQSALNQQLLKLEKELGTPLFYRSRTDWHPTPAGEIYLNAAKDILLIKKNAYNQIHDLCEAQKGHITLGFTPGRGIAMFTSVYPKFHNICPNIEVEPIERSVRDQHPLLLSGELDLGFMTLTRSQQKSGIIYETLASEEMVLAVPTKLVTALDMRNGDLALLREEPFVLTQKTSTIREIVDSIFKNAGFTPNVLFETSNNHAIISMIHENICCGILPMYYMDPEDEAITYFQLPDHPSWEIVAAYRKGHYISKPARTLIELAGNYFYSCNTSLAVLK